MTSLFERLATGFTVICILVIVYFVVDGTSMAIRQHRGETAVEGTCFVVRYQNAEGDPQTVTAKRLNRVSDTRIVLRDVTRYGQVGPGPYEVTSPRMLIQPGECQ